MYYFAYGSNLLTARLTARTPSARPVGIAHLPGWQLRFHKAGTDGSGKGDIVPVDGDRVTGVLYRLRPRELRRLDRAEGAGYARRRIAVRIDGHMQRCETYIATDTDPALRPYDWYRRLILAGLLEHGIAGATLQLVQQQLDIPDPRTLRPARLRALQALRDFQKRNPSLASRLIAATAYGPAARDWTAPSGSAGDSPPEVH